MSEVTDVTPAQQFALDKLDVFKNRLHITTTDTSEMDRIKFMLEVAYTMIMRRVGATNDTDPEVVGLILEAARYDYWDAKDEFYKNYSEDIYELFLSEKNSAEKNSTSVTTTDPITGITTITSTNSATGVITVTTIDTIAGTKTVTTTSTLNGAIT